MTGLAGCSISLYPFPDEHAALLVAAHLPMVRRCMPVSRLGGAPASDSRPENHNVDVWEQCTRISKRSSSRWHSRQGVAQPSVPSHSWRYTQMSAPSLRLTQLTIWCCLTPCTLACRTQTLRSLQNWPMPTSCRRCKARSVPVVNARAPCTAGQV